MLPPSSFLVDLFLLGGLCLIIDCLVLTCPSLSALEEMEILVQHPFGLVAS
jgi:hypothetical protein